MSIEQELGEIRGELRGILREQQRSIEDAQTLSTAVDSLTKAIGELPQRLPCISRLETCHSKIEEKLSWKPYMWITGLLFAIMVSTMSVVWSKALDAHDLASKATVIIEQTPTQGR